MPLQLAVFDAPLSTCHIPVSHVALLLCTFSGTSVLLSTCSRYTQLYYQVRSRRCESDSSFISLSIGQHVSSSRSPFL